MQGKLSTRNRQRIQRGVISILEGMGYTNWRGDQNLKGTPLRVARMFEEMAVFDQAYLDSIWKAIFPSSNSQMLLLRGITAVGVCPHHLMAIRYKAAVAYIPKEKVLGLSKIARLVEVYCQQLVLQEDVTDWIADAIEKRLEPRGTMVVLEGVHGCMSFRGTRQREAVTITSAVRGVFRDPNERAREEFLALLRDGGTA